MKNQEARQFGAQLAALLSDEDFCTAYAFLAPILAQKTPFRSLDLIGEQLGKAPKDLVDTFTRQIA